MIGTEAGLRVKTIQGRGGVVDNITITNVRMMNVVQPFDIDMTYHGKLEEIGELGSPTPIFRNIHISNIEVFNVLFRKVANWAANLNIDCLPQSPCLNISLHNVTVYSDRVRSCFSHVSGTFIPSSIILQHYSPNNLVPEDLPIFPFTTDLDSENESNIPDLSEILSHSEKRRTVQRIVSLSNPTKLSQPVLSLLLYKDYSSDQNVGKEMNFFLEMQDQALRGSDLTWLTIPYQKRWREVEYENPTVVGINPKQLASWQKYHLNQKRYEANWDKFSSNSRETLSLPLLVVVLMSVAFWWGVACYFKNVLHPKTRIWDLRTWKSIPK